MASGHEVSVRFTGDPRELVEACKTVEDALSGVQKNTKDTSNGISTATKETDGLSSSFSKFALVAGTVVVAFQKFIKVLDEYSQYALESERATIVLMTSIANSGRQVNTELNKFRDIADKVSHSTLFQDKQVEQAEAFLIATQQLDDELTERTLKVATDLATMMGDNLPNTAKALSRALTDPTYATFAFQRAGIKLSDTTSDLAKQLMEEGKQAEAQTVILEELERRYSGLAEAVGKLDSSEMTKIKNNLLDIKEALGQIMTSSFKGFLELLDKATTRIANLLDRLALLAKGGSAVDDAKTMYPDMMRAIYTNEQLVEGLEQAQLAKKAIDDQRASMQNDTWMTPQYNELVTAIATLSTAIYRNEQAEKENTTATNENTIAKEEETDKNSYAYKWDELKKEEDNAWQAYLNAQSKSEEDFEYQRYLDARQARMNLEIFGDASHKKEMKSAGLRTSKTGLGAIFVPKFGGQQYVFDGTSFKPMISPQFDADIPTLTGDEKWSFLKNQADAWVVKLEEEERKQEELTTEKRRLYNLLDDSQIGTIRDLEAQYKNGSKDMQYWDKQKFAREVFADLDISGLTGEAYREYLRAWGEIVEDIEKSEEEWNAESKESRLRRMHEMNDALLKEREEGLKKMAEMEEFSLKKSLDSFIENFGGEHEDPFIGYSESIDMMTGAMNSFYNTIRNGQGVLEAFKNAFFRVVDQIIEKLIALLAVEAISSIFGLNGAEIANASAHTMNAGKVMKTSLSSSLSNMYKSNMFSFAPAKYMGEGQGVKNVIFNIDGFVSSNEADFTRRVRETMNNGEFLVNIT